MKTDILTRTDRDSLSREVMTFCRDELELEMGNMDAGFLIDKLVETMGAAFYNAGLQDASQLLAQRTETLREDLYALERPWSGRR